MCNSYTPLYFTRFPEFPLRGTWINCFSSLWIAQNDLKIERLWNEKTEVTITGRHIPASRVVFLSREQMTISSKAVSPQCSEHSSRVRTFTSASCRISSSPLVPHPASSRGVSVWNERRVRQGLFYDRFQCVNPSNISHIWSKALFTLTVWVCIFLWSLPLDANVRFEYHHLLP